MSLRNDAVRVLTTADPSAKAALTAEAAARWRGGAKTIGAARPPDRPARPERPELLRPGEMPKRSSGPKGRIALVHALTHIEFNAIDLAWDIIARFGDEELPEAFFDDWVNVAAEEAEHFDLLRGRLEQWGVKYGDLPAHNGLWEAAEITADDLVARLAIVPMTLEARGLDTTVQGAAKLRQNEDAQTADILAVIYSDEIKHLAVGVRWFEHLCSKRGVDPVATYKQMIDTRFTGKPKPPFNFEARAQAGMGPEYLQPWIDLPGARGFRNGTTPRPVSQKRGPPLPHLM
ncbi:MAG: ferritin-like domain-containing protein [Rhodospirillaceae bacterium]